MSIATEVQRLQTAKADIKTAIEAKGVVVDETAKIDTYASKVDDVYDAGYEKGKSEGDGFPEDMEWTYHIKDVSINASYFTKETETITMMSGASLDFVVNDDYINTTTKHIIVNYNQPPRGGLDRIFYLLDSLYGYGMQAWERLTFNADTSNVTSFRQMLQYAGLLTTIDGTPLDFSSSTNNNGMFKGCSKLVYIRIVPKTIKSNADFSGSGSWDYDSLDSIFEGLAPLTEAEPQTLTMNTQLQATIEANQDWLDKVTGRNWTLAFT